MDTEKGGPLGLKLPLPFLLVVGAALAAGGAAVSGVGPWSPGAVDAQQTTIRVVAPATVSPGTTSFQVEVQVEDIPPPASGCETNSPPPLPDTCGLGGYEWELVYDPAVIELTDPANKAMADGGFLGSTGRRVMACAPLLPPALNLPPGHVRFSCASDDPDHAEPFTVGPSGSGLLSTVTFRAVAEGGSPLNLAPTSGLGDTWGKPISASLALECGVETGSES